MRRSLEKNFYHSDRLVPKNSNSGDSKQQQLPSAKSSSEKAGSKRKLEDDSNAERRVRPRISNPPSDRSDSDRRESSRYSEDQGRDHRRQSDRDSGNRDTRGTKSPSPHRQKHWDNSTSRQEDEAKIAEYQQINSKLQEENKALQGLIAELKKTIENLKVVANKQVENDTTIKVLRAENDSLKIQLADKIATYKNLQDEQTQQKQTINNLQIQIAVLNNPLLRSYMVPAPIPQASNPQLIKENTDLKAHIPGLLDEIAALEKNYQNLDKQKEALLQDLNTLKNSIDSKEAMMRKLIESQQELRQEIVQLTDLNQYLQGQLQAQKNANEQLTRTNAELEDVRVKQDSAIAKLHQICTQQGDKIRELEGNCLEQNRLIASLQGAPLQYSAAGNPNFVSQQPRPQAQAPSQLFQASAGNHMSDSQSNGNFGNGFSRDSRLGYRG